MLRLSSVRGQSGGVRRLDLRFWLILLGLRYAAWHAGPLVVLEKKGSREKKVEREMSKEGRERVCVRE